MADTITNEAAGEPRTMKSVLLETGAAMAQDFSPIKSICAHLNALHVYASDRTRCVEANHYCSHLNEDVRQCLIYDAPTRPARLIGIEYMISPRLYETLPASERLLWHSHVFEVKSGMLVMPTPSAVPNGAWEVAETKEMEDVVGLYGKTYHLWQVDRGDRVPLGQPELMMSFNKQSQVDIAGGRDKWAERDRTFGVDSAVKREKRAHIEEPEVHEDADSMWKKDGPPKAKDESGGANADGGKIDMH